VTTLLALYSLKNQLNLIMTFNGVIIVAFVLFMPIDIPKKVPD